jgi:hypothetical protein
MEMVRKSLYLMPMIAVLLIMSLGCGGIPFISQGSATPKVGHWEGEPSLSFDVTEGGEIRDFEATVPFGALGGSCTIRIGKLDPKDGEYVFGDPSEQDYPQYITGKFTNSETFKGVYAISACQSGGNYSIAFNVDEEPLTAKWKSQ